MNPHFSLISQILRSVWSIDSKEVNAWLPQISLLLKGEIPKDNKDLEPLALQFLNSEGKSFYSSAENLNDSAIAVFSIEGPMMKKGDWCSYGTEEIASMMVSAISNENVKGTILKFDTGGGTVDSVLPLVNAIRKSKEASKPVFAYVDSALSAGYKVACECDKIIASNNMALFGSIGVMMRFPNSDKYSKEVLGLEIIEIYAPESSDKNLPYREAINGKVELIQNEILSPYANEFISSVKSARGEKLNTKVKGLLSGKVFFAEESIANGLADEINTSFESIVNEIFNFQNNNLNFNSMTEKKKPSFSEKVKELFSFTPAEVKEKLSMYDSLNSEKEHLKQANFNLERDNIKLRADLDIAEKAILEKDAEISVLKAADGAQSANANTTIDPQLTAKENKAVFDEKLSFDENFQRVKEKYYPKN